MRPYEHLRYLEDLEFPRIAIIYSLDFSGSAVFSLDSSGSMISDYSGPDLLGALPN
jgi:hypothetical protein